MQREIDDMSVKATGPTSVRRAPAVDRSRSVRARYRRFYRLMAITDVAAIVSACLLAYLFWIPDRPADPGLVVLLLIAGPPVVLALYSAIHLYEAHRYSPTKYYGTAYCSSAPTKTRASNFRCAPCVPTKTRLHSARFSRRQWHSALRQGHSASPC